MPNQQRPDESSYRPEDSPVVWFVMLERARRSSDFELAAKAQQELERLGVKVKYSQTRSRQEVEDGQ